MKRCAWPSTPLDIAYHDKEWGVPVHDERVLFEFLILEGAQAGLSWSTILNKRENYRKAFAGFEPKKVSRFSKRKLQQLMRDEGIVRNRLKIDSAVTNAKAFLAVQKEFGSFDRYIWQFVGGKPLKNARRGGDIPARTPNRRAPYDADCTTPRRSARPPAMRSSTSRSSGWSWRQTSTKKASRSTCRIRVVTGSAPPRPGEWRWP